MLLSPTTESGERGKDIFRERMRKFLNGQWDDLLTEATARATEASQHATKLDDERRRISQAEAKVRLREVSRARVHMTSAGIAPGTPQTLSLLTDESLTPRTLHKPIPDSVVNHRPVLALTLDKDGLWRGHCGPQAKVLPQIYSVCSTITYAY